MIPRRWLWPASLISSAAICFAAVPATPASAAPIGEEPSSSASEGLETAQQRRAARALEHAERRAARASERAERRALREQERALRVAQRDDRRAHLRSSHERAANSDEAGAPTPRSTTRGVAGCSITVAASSPRVTAGESVTISGSLSCPHTSSLGDRQVTFYEGHNGPQPDHTPAAEATTHADGSYSFTSAPLSENTVLRVHIGLLGSLTVVKVAPRVTLSGPSPSAESSTVAGDAHPRMRQRLTFSGTVDPYRAGALVKLQVSYPSGPAQWRTVAYGHVDEGGSYSISRNFATPGETMIRTVVKAGQHMSPATSEVISFDAAQPQNPALTIGVSADPVVAGASVLVTGQAAGRPDEPVTLAARTPDGTILATATTDQEGNYSFTQTPQQNTDYTVTDGATSSSTVVERVGVQLTAGAVEVPAQAGQQVTLSGSLAPEGASRTVLLQRENASGTGFTTVASAAPTSGSTYTIPFTFAQAGSHVMRFKLTGTSANFASVSEPFTVLVSP
jgi:hypothetical protein